MPATGNHKAHRCSEQALPLVGSRLWGVSESGRIDFSFRSSHCRGLPPSRRDPSGAAPSRTSASTDRIRSSYSRRIPRWQARSRASPGGSRQPSMSAFPVVRLAWARGTQTASALAAGGVAHAGQRGRGEEDARPRHGCSRRGHVDRVAAFSSTIQTRCHAPPWIRGCHRTARNWSTGGRDVKACEPTPAHRSSPEPTYGNPGTMPARQGGHPEPTPRGMEHGMNLGRSFPFLLQCRRYRPLVMFRFWRPSTAGSRSAKRLRSPDRSASLGPLPGRDARFIPRLRHPSPA